MPESDPPRPDGTPALPITVVGGGHVGLIAAVCMAAQGLTIRLVENDDRRRGQIADGRTPIFEPRLEGMLSEALAAGRMTVTADLAAATRGGGLVFIAVGTPENADGSTDLRALQSCAQVIARNADPGTVVVIKSTVPPGTTRSLAVSLRTITDNLALVMCPEFLREGVAIHDYQQPARVVIGGDDPDVIARVARVVVPDPSARLIVADSTSAELVKYGSNAFLATKISFINELARMCDLAGGNIDVVAEGVGSDPRIAPGFLHAGLGYGGSCFPKDVQALAHAAGSYGHSFWMLNAATEVNQQQRRRFVRTIQETLGESIAGSRIAIAGLAYKPETDDMRHAPAIEIVQHLVGLGATVVATDPAASETARPHVGDIAIVDSLAEAVAGADAVAVVTEWQQFCTADWRQLGSTMRRRLVFDGRNCLDPERMVAEGFEYHGIGRPVRRPLPVTTAVASGDGQP